MQHFAAPTGIHPLWSTTELCRSVKETLKASNGVRPPRIVHRDEFAEKFFGLTWHELVQPWPNDPPLRTTRGPFH